MHHASNCLHKLSSQAASLTVLCCCCSSHHQAASPLCPWLLTSHSSTRWPYTLPLLPTISRSCLMASLPLRTVLRDGNTEAGPAGPRPLLMPEPDAASPDAACSQQGPTQQAGHAPHKLSSTHHTDCQGGST